MRHHPVRVHDIAEHDIRTGVEPDAPELTGNGLGIGVEDREAQRARVHASAGVGAQIVPARDSVDMQDRAGLVAVANVDHIAARTHDPAVRMNRDAAHAATFRDHGRDGAGRVEAVDTAAEHVGEHERSVRVDRRGFGEPVAVCEHVPFHQRLFYHPVGL